MDLRCLRFDLRFELPPLPLPAPLLPPVPALPPPLPLPAVPALLEPDGVEIKAAIAADGKLGELVAAETRCCRSTDMMPLGFELGALAELVSTPPLPPPPPPPPPLGACVLDDCTAPPLDSVGHLLLSTVPLAERAVLSASRLEVLTSERLKSDRDRARCGSTLCSVGVLSSAAAGGSDAPVTIEADELETSDNDGRVKAFFFFLRLCANITDDAAAADALLPPPPPPLSRSSSESSSSSSSDDATNVIKAI